MELADTEGFTPRKLPQFLAGSFGSMCGMLVGMGIAWPTLALPSLADTKDLDAVGWETSTWAVSNVFIAALLTVLPTGWLVDRVGRRMTMMALCIPSLLGWLLIIFAPRVEMLIIGRLITGLCMGGFSIVTPLYVGEVVTEKLRGHFGCMYQNQVVQGYLFIYINGHSHSWRALSIFCAGIHAPILIAMYFMPESPVYLISQGKAERAKVALKWLRGAKTPEQIEPELEQMRRAAEETASPIKERPSGVLGRESWGPLLYCGALLVVYQLGYCMYLVFPVRSIFDAAGVHWSLSACLIAFGAAGAVGVLVASLLVDRVGRKPLLWISLIALTPCWISLGIFTVGNLTVLPAAGAIYVLVCLLTSQVAFNIGLGPIPWILLVELIPPRVRGKMAAVPVTLSWLTGLILLLAYQSLVVTESVSTLYWICGILIILVAIGTIYIVPETRWKRSVEIMDRL